MIEENKGSSFNDDVSVNYIEIVRNTFRAYWPLYVSAF